MQMGDGRLDDCAMVLLKTLPMAGKHLLGTIR
jgi:hypothetical protein